MPEYPEMPSHAVRITFTVSMPGYTPEEVGGKLAELFESAGVAGVFAGGIAKVEIKPIPQPKPEQEPDHTDEDRATVDSFLKGLGGAA